MAVAVPRPVRNLLLLGSTALQHLGDDPIQLALQISRRLPHRTADATGRMLARRRWTPARALGLLLSGRDEELDTLLEETLPTALRGTGLRVLAEIAVQHDRHDLLEPLGTAVPRAVRARSRWALGDLDGALELLAGARGGGAVRGRLAGERALLVPDTDLPAPAPANLGSAKSAGSNPAPRNARTVDAATPPRVLHILTNSLPHTQSGYSLRSHRVLSAQRDHGLQVEAVTRIGYPVMVGKWRARDVDTVDGIRYLRILPTRLRGTKPDRLAAQADWVARHALATGAGVLHATTNYENGLVARAAARRTGLPWIYEVRGMQEDTWAAARRTPAAEQTALASRKHALIRAREAELSRSADAVVTLNRAMHDDLVARGVDPARTTIVPNAVEARFLEPQPDPAEARRRLGLPEEGFWIGSVSALVDYEGFDILLDAARLLVDSGIDVRVLLVGDGVSRPGLQQQAERLGIADRVHLPGRLPTAQAPLAHAALDVFCCPRRDTPVCRTVSPSKVVEAMAVGRPVVASDLPALREQVVPDEDATAGLLVPAGVAETMAEAVSSLCHDRTMRSTLSAAGQRAASALTWENNGTRYADVIHGVVVGSAD